MSNSKCIKCDRCLPCAADIHISKVITFIDTMQKIDLSNKEEVFKILHDEELSKQMKNAENCRRCYKCNRLCPKKIDVPLEITFNLSAYKKFVKENRP